MKKDLRMLAELRKGPLVGMDEDEFKMIEEDVKKFGFNGLSGYAKSTVQRAMRMLGGEINKAVAQRKAELEKHADHDQLTHGGSGGGGDSGDTSKSPATPLASPAGATFSRPSQTRSLNAIANEIVSDPNYKGNTKTYAQPYIAALHQMNDIEDNYYADSGESVVRYALSNLGTWRGEVARNIKAELNAMLKSYDGSVSKATSISVGDRVSWNASGGGAEGKVLRIERSGKINVPDSSFEIEGSEDDPAALIVLYRDGKPTDTKVGHKISTLKKK